LWFSRWGRRPSTCTLTSRSNERLGLCFCGFVFV
jgi:hypothetical protein